MTGQIRVWADNEISKINSNIYGSFAEHLGRCIYGGIWVGPDSRIPNEAGLRTDVVEALAAMKLPVLRWPGGCFADDYHWEWGLGAQRRKRRNLWWHQPEDNSCGTEEVIRRCRVVGCEPYICANVGSGTVEEAVNWMEYCNSTQNSYYADLRRQNGNKEPFGVRYWGVGNENWGCGGSMSPEQYSYEYRKYATYMRKMGLDIEGGVYLIACGYDETWNVNLLRALEGRAHLADGLSIHLYRGRQSPSATEFEDRHHYLLMGDVVEMAERVQKAADLLGFFSTSDHQIGLVIDEWGTWYPEATVENGLYQQSALRDGLFTAAALNMFNNHCDSIVMTNMAQTVNVLQAVILTQGSDMVLTPTYHAYEMMKNHQDATLVASKASSTSLSDEDSREFDALSISASKSADGKTLVLSVVNQSLEHDCETDIIITGVETIGAVAGRILASDDIRHHNTFEQPEKVQPREAEISAEGTELHHTFPAKSLTVLEIAL